MTWPSVELRDHIDVLSGFAFKSEKFNLEARGLPLIRIRDVLSGSTSTFYDGPYKPEFLVQRNSILVGMDGEFNMARWRGPESLLNQRVCRISVRGDRLDERYLFWFLPLELKKIEAKTPFATVKHLSGEDIRSIKLRIPPLYEQRRIAAILDQVDQLRQKRATVLEKLLRLKRSLYADALAHPKQGVGSLNLGSMADVTMGQSPRGDSYNDRGVGVPLLNGPSEFGERHPIEGQWTESPTKTVRQGDILFCVRGATAGRLNWADKEYCIGRGLASIRVKDPLDAGFIYECLAAGYAWFQAKGVGSTFINISKEQLESYQIPALTLRERREYSERATLVSGSIAVARDHFAALSALLHNLQTRAFSGTFSSVFDFN